MKHFWVPSKKTINGHHCIEHTVNRQIMLIGKYGEIWQVDKSEYRAIVYSHRIARRYLPESDWPRSAEDEVLVRFFRGDLHNWIRRLLVPKKSTSQLKLAIEIKSTSEPPVQNEK